MTYISTISLLISPEPQTTERERAQTFRDELLGRIFSPEPASSKDTPFNGKTEWCRVVTEYSVNLWGDNQEILGPKVCVCVLLLILTDSQLICSSSPLHNSIRHGLQAGHQRPPFLALSLERPVSLLLRMWTPLGKTVQL